MKAARPRPDPRERPRSPRGLLRSPRAGAVLAVLGGAAIVAVKCAPGSTTPSPAHPPPASVPGLVASHAPRAGAPERGLLVALFGDQGLGPASRAVLEIVRRRPADLAIHAGDFDYEDDADAWDAQISSVLGEGFPYFACVGNHDLDAWPRYQAKLLARLARIRGAECSGDLGVRSSCYYRGLFFVLSGAGTLGTGHEAYLASELARDRSAWQLCVWHKNQHDMQVGAKVDEVGWGAYRACQKAGAPIVTAHEHSYARSYVLGDLGNAAAEHGKRGRPERLELGPDRTFVLVSGLGGHSRRRFLGVAHDDDTWWASIHARGRQVRNAVVRGEAPDVEDGVAFLEFGSAGDPSRARGWFETVSGAIVDEFEVIRAR